MNASREGETMANTDSRVTIHMAASLDGFARLSSNVRRRVEFDLDFSKSAD